MKFLKKLVYGYDKLEEYLLCGSLVVTTLIIFAQIIMRSIFNSSLTWSEELTRYIFIWQIWLGVSIAERDHAHIKLEITNSLIKNETVKDVLDILASIVWLAFCGFLFVVGCQLVAQMYARGNVSSAMRLPMYIVYIVLPLSSAILSLRLLGRLVGDIKALFHKNKEVA